MERGVETRNQMANLVSGAEAIEIKVTVPRQQIEPGLAHFGLTIDNKQGRFIYFFDTPDLKLLQAGVIARVRRVVGGEHDSTIKIRPVDPSRVSRVWRKYRGFKVEADGSEKGVTKSASLTMPVRKGLIKQVAAGAKSIKKLFTSEQARFVVAMGPKTVDLSEVVVMGPMEAWRWKLADPALPWPLTVELWKRGDGAMMLEASIKAPVVQAAAATGGFMMYLRELGAERDEGQETKTRWALNYYAGQFATLTSSPR